MSAACPLCPFTLDGTALGDIKHHLKDDHKLLINKLEEIPESELNNYLNHWRDLFRLKSYTQICTENNDGLFVLCPDRLPQDKSLRSKLSVDRLRKVLKVQEKERTSNDLSRQCLFCKQILCGNRCVFLDHLSSKHNFSIGHPDNIVYIEEFIDLIDNQLKQLKCLCCEGSFKTWDSLKEHMRKKNHRQLNPDNKLYDKYYLINYLEPGKDWKSLADEPSNVELSESEINEWADWIEDDASVSFLCLFCSVSHSSIESLSSHLLSSHQFNFESVNTWPFYKKVRLINFIRQCSSENICFLCQVTFNSQGDLEDHFNSSKHTSLLPEESIWLTAASFIPVNREDALLYHLDSRESASSHCDPAQDEPVVVLPEDCSLSKVSPCQSIDNS